MTADPPPSATDSNPFVDVQRATTKSWLRGFDLGIAWNRAAVSGLAAGLRTSAAMTELSVSTVHGSMLAALEAQRGFVPLSGPAAQAVENSLDEAMAAVEASTAESTRAVADDLVQSVENTAAATTIQRNVQYALAIQLLGFEPEFDDGRDPVRIELQEN